MKASLHKRHDLGVAAALQRRLVGLEGAQHRLNVAVRLIHAWQFLSNFCFRWYPSCGEIGYAASKSRTAGRGRLVSSPRCLHPLPKMHALLARVAIASHGDVALHRHKRAPMRHAEHRAVTVVDVGIQFHVVCLPQPQGGAVYFVAREKPWVRRGCRLDDARGLEVQIPTHLWLRADGAQGIDREEIRQGLWIDAKAFVQSSTDSRLWRLVAEQLHMGSPTSRSTTTTAQELRLLHKNHRPVCFGMLYNDRHLDDRDAPHQVAILDLQVAKAESKFSCQAAHAKRPSIVPALKQLTVPRDQLVHVSLTSVEVPYVRHMGVSCDTFSAIRSSAIVGRILGRKA
mmetsp:Transcript_91363/g.258049  ORF Transcript_91363/g.258049 Transcript_91363/m.258049 type:complete len:342 (+) Transcript_91363:1764-2789(+)